jgi:hypothetical protein
MVKDAVKFGIYTENSRRHSLANCTWRGGKRFNCRFEPNGPFPRTSTLKRSQPVDGDAFAAVDNAESACDGCSRYQALPAVSTCSMRRASGHVPVEDASLADP